MSDLNPVCQQTQKPGHGLFAPSRAYPNLHVLHFLDNRELHAEVQNLHSSFLLEGDIDAHEINTAFAHGRLKCLTIKCRSVLTSTATLQEVGGRRKPN